MSPETLLCILLDQRAPVLAADYQVLAAYQVLLNSGLIEERGFVSSIVCNECDTPHDAEIVFEAGKYGYFCPDLGFLVRERSELAAATPNVKTLITRLADALACRQRKASPISGSIWRVGFVDSDQGQISVYYRSRLITADDFQLLDEALAREIRTQYRMVLTAAQTAGFKDHKIASLSDVIDIDARSGSISFTSDLHALCDLPVQNKAGRPSPHRERLQTLMQERAQSGEVLEGVNAEAKALMAMYKEQFPTESAPSLSTVKRHLKPGS